MENKMKLKINTTKTFLFLALIFTLSCSSEAPRMFSPSPVTGPEYITSTHKVLKMLPPPSQPIYVAVYKFRDQTGQYKPPTTSTNFSTAVTQGATSILIKALEDSGWFIPLERENLPNLLQERRIIRQMRDIYAKDKETLEKIDPLPPLYYAGILLEGGIIGYDSDILTGGLGAKYFGIGGSVQYRIDRVTVYLRAVSVKTGAILKTVQTTKVILSREVSAGIYRFVRLNRLLEIESGLSTNEPVEMAVQEAIEKAVLDLIIEGAKIGIWKPKDEREFNSYVKSLNY
ncbi:MAG: CsgG/HfaB family protein [Thermosulfidibacteraceae bacterium]